MTHWEWQSQISQGDERGGWEGSEGMRQQGPSTYKTDAHPQDPHLRKSPAAPYCFKYNSRCPSTGHLCLPLPLHVISKSTPHAILLFPVTLLSFPQCFLGRYFFLAPTNSIQTLLQESPVGTGALSAGRCRKGLFLSEKQGTSDCMAVGTYLKHQILSCSTEAASETVHCPTKAIITP